MYVWETFKKSIWLYLQEVLDQRFDFFVAKIVFVAGLSESPNYLKIIGLKTLNWFNNFHVREIKNKLIQQILLQVWVGKVGEIFIDDEDGIHKNVSLPLLRIQMPN